ncbi:hypothetical protein NKH36_12510 [Mesorhizobium sp. M1312]|uniref:hypothetical protein n=1 Tax=unclassified Mesorhizobium TaxID=325217 RepID=UPI003335CF7D
MSALTGPDVPGQIGHPNDSNFHRCPCDLTTNKLGPPLGKAGIHQILDVASYLSDDTADHLGPWPESMPVSYMKPQYDPLWMANGH